MRAGNARTDRVPELRSPVLRSKTPGAPCAVRMGGAEPRSGAVLLKGRGPRIAEQFGVRDCFSDDFEAIFAEFARRVRPGRFAPNTDVALNDDGQAVVV